MHQFLNITKTILTTVLFVFIPISAWGTVGFAERHSQLHYNQFATVHWIHPGDGCDSGKYCFHIAKIDNKYQRFKSLNSSFQKINIPADKKIPLIFAQYSTDTRWLVYNLHTEQCLMQTDNYEAALNVWKANGLKEPEFSNALNGAQGLYRTWASRIEDWTWMAFLFLPLFVIIALLLFTISTLWSAIQFYRTRQRKYLLMFIFSLIPSIFLWFLSMRFVGFR